MAIKIGGTTVIDDSRGLQNISNVKTIGGQSIFGSGDITVSAGASGSQTILLDSVTCPSGVYHLTSDTPQVTYVYTDGGTYTINLPSDTSGMTNGFAPIVIIAKNDISVKQPNSSTASVSLGLNDVAFTILKSDGSWGVFKEEANSLGFALSQGNVFLSNVSYTSLAYLEPNKLLLAYKANGSTDNRLKACTVTLSSNTVTFGEPASLDEGFGSFVDLCTISTSKVLAVMESGGNGIAKILNISGSAISVTSGTTYKTGFSYGNKIAKVGTDKYVVLYQHSTSPYTVYAKVLSVNGSFVNGGPPVTLGSGVQSSGGNLPCSIVSAGTDRVVVSFSSTGSNIVVAALTVSGTTITVDTLYNLTGYRHVLTSLSPTKALLICEHSPASYSQTGAYVLSLGTSGTAISSNYFSFAIPSICNRHDPVACSFDANSVLFSFNGTISGLIKVTGTAATATAINLKYATETTWFGAASLIKINDSSYAVSYETGLPSGVVKIISDVL